MKYFIALILLLGLKAETPQCPFTNFYSCHVEETHKLWSGNSEDDFLCNGIPHFDEAENINLTFKIG